MRKNSFRLVDSDRLNLDSRPESSSKETRHFKRVRCLRLLDSGETRSSVCASLGVSSGFVAGLITRYKSHGLDCLSDKERPGRPLVISGESRALITALACSDPPEGHKAWTLRLLGERYIELGYGGSISHTHVGRVLKKTSCTPTSKSTGA